MYVAQAADTMNLTNLSTLVQRSSFAISDNDSEKRDAKRKRSVSVEEIFNSADRFGLRTCVVRMRKPIRHTEILEEQLDSALQPLLSGDKDVVLVSVTDFETGADVDHSLAMVDAKSQQLVQHGVSVVVAEDWDESNGTAASIILCKSKSSGGKSAGVRSAGRHNVWEIAFD